MYPPKVSDETILRLIRELTQMGRLPSGAMLRATLAQRYQSRGGVTRIYRLLQSEQTRLGSYSRSPIGERLLEQQNRNLHEQLRRAREREDAHQAYWSREIGQLQERMKALEPVVQVLEGGAREKASRQELRDVSIRAGQLEVSLRAFGPAAGRSQLKE